MNTKMTYRCFLLTLILQFVINQILFAENNSNKKESEIIQIEKYSPSLLLLLNYHKQKMSICSTYLEKSEEDSEISKKSPWLAFGLAIMLPGAGQIYNGEYSKLALMYGAGIIGALISVGTLYFSDYDYKKEEPAFVKSIVLTGFIIIPFAWLWSIIDAPTVANSINKKNKKLSGSKTYLSKNGNYALNLGYDNFYKSYSVGMQFNF